MPSMRGGQLLWFGNGNAKLDKAIFTFSLPAGWTCPGAKACLAKVPPEGSRLRDGKDAVFRCYSASEEARHTTVRNARWSNFSLLQHKTRSKMRDLILLSLSEFAGIVRVHVAGDFFSIDYLDSWLEVAMMRPHTRFYWYTKSIPYWLKRFHLIGDGHSPGELPNVIPTASYGGRWDHLIEPNELRSARVVFSVQEASRLGLHIDHDDSYAMKHGDDFALLIHGSQPTGSDAGQAVQNLKEQRIFGYSRKISLPLL